MTFMRSTLKLHIYPSRTATPKITMIFTAIKYLDNKQKKNGWKKMDPWMDYSLCQPRMTKKKKKLSDCPVHRREMSLLSLLTCSHLVLQLLGLQ